jgi:hypothetical protein
MYIQYPKTFSDASKKEPAAPGKRVKDQVQQVVLRHLFMDGRNQKLVVHRQ